MVRRTLRALLAALLLALAVVASPRPAAAEGPEYIDTVINSISAPTIDVTNPSQVVELQGTLTNTSTVPITWLEVDIWRMANPITSPSRLNNLLDNPDALPLEGRLTDPELGHRQVLTMEEQFGPGERIDFSVSATLSELGFVEEGGAYIVGVQARGLPADGPKRTLGRDQVVLPATTGEVDSSALVVLTAPPTWLPDGSFTDGSLANDLAERLDVLLTSAERPEVIAAIDPALYVAAQRLTEPHIVDGTERPGSGIALRWVDRIDALADEGRLWRLPYGNPDLARADASGMLQQVLAWARTADPAGFDDLPSVAILDAGAGNELVARLSEFDTIVVRNATGASPGPPQLIGAAPQGGITRLATDIQLARRIAEELISDRPPLHLIDSPQDAEADAGAGRRHVAISATPAEPVNLPDGPATAPWNVVAAALDEAESTSTFSLDLTGEAPARQDRLGALAFSDGFANEAEAANYVTAATPAPIDTSLVELRAAQQFVMGARTNTFPATLTNGLDVPITVRVQFRSESPQRISVPPTDLVTVEPGQSVTVEITPQATSNGVAMVHANVVTEGGVAIGTPQTIEITATDLGRVGWLIILVSGAVVVGGTALRIRAVRKQRAKEEREPGQ